MGGCLSFLFFNPHCKCDYDDSCDDKCYPAASSSLTPSCKEYSCTNANIVTCERPLFIGDTNHYRNCQYQQEFVQANAMRQDPIYNEYLYDHRKYPQNPYMEAPKPSAPPLL